MASASVTFHYDDNLDGGLGGVSKASGFIQRKMAEAKATGYKDTSDLVVSKKKNSKFNVDKVKNASAFLHQHIKGKSPWQPARAIPILSTGQKAKRRVLDGKVVDFSKPDAKYNPATLPLYPLPRGDARKLSETEEKHRKDAIEAYTEVLKKMYPEQFKPRPTPSPSENVIENGVTTSKKVSRKKVEKKPKTSGITFNRPMKFDKDWNPVPHEVSFD